MNDVKLPTSQELLKTTVEGIRALGGKATNKQILEWAISSLRLTPEQTGLIRAGNRTELEYRLAWARTKARKQGLIMRIGPSCWAVLEN
jgi:restriction system protein